MRLPRKRLPRSRRRRQRTWARCWTVFRPISLRSNGPERARAQLRSFLAAPRSFRFPVSPNPEVSVLLVLFNKAELTFGCLRSLQEITDLACETIIVDNASSDDTETLLSKIEGANVIRNTQNLHFLKSVNQAARAASGRYLLILNNDTQRVPGSGSRPQSPRSGAPTTSEPLAAG